MIGLWRGRSFRSRVAEFVNWSPYSHASWIEEDGSNFEAWPPRVVWNKSVDVGHTPGTIIDLFGVRLTQEDREKLRDCFRCQIGKRYDWLGILHFVTRRPPYRFQQNEWFCSEVLASGFELIGMPLLARIPPWKVYPGMLAYSPLLIPAGRIVTKRPENQTDLQGGPFALDSGCEPPFGATPLSRGDRSKC